MQTAAEINKGLSDIVNALDAVRVHYPTCEEPLFRVKMQIFQLMNKIEAKASPTEGIEAMAEEQFPNDSWGRRVWIEGYKSGLSASPSGMDKR